MPVPFSGPVPTRERFPSTSTAKTTIHDTEIVLAEGNWRGVVTFALSDEVREYLNECISAAVLSAAKGANEVEVLRRLLNHVNQRFRFSYVLGNGPAAPVRDLDFEDDEEETEGEPDLLSAEEHGAIDLASTDKLLAHITEKLRELARRIGDRLRAELDVRGEEDERVADELFEEELDNLLRDEEDFHEVADDLMEEIEKRFDLLPPGKIQKTRQGWLLAWSGEWPSEKRAEFLRAISRFSSNHAPLFGRLLTPLVGGVGVAGPFSAEWNGGEMPKLVLLDGEGLGHTPKSSSAVSTAVSRRIEAADAVLLVDSATQPMQAARHCHGAPGLRRSRWPGSPTRMNKISYNGYRFPARDHSASDLALPPVHPQPARRRGFVGGTWHVRREPSSTRVDGAKRP